MTRKHLISSIIYCGLLTSTLAYSLTLTSTAFTNNHLIPNRYLYCQASHDSRLIVRGKSISPALNWQHVPTGTKSFVLLVADHDVAKVSYFNSKKKSIKLNTPRSTFYHWVVINIPSQLRHLKQGAGSTGFVIGGIKPGQRSYGVNGLNLYNISMNSALGSKRLAFGHKGPTRGTYGGYGGMCAPFNDKRIHSYDFSLYALDVAKLKLPTDGHFDGKQVMQAITGHIIESAHLIGKSITNPQHLNQSQSDKPSPTVKPLKLSHERQKN